jgi:hypothetical protein
MFVKEMNDHEGRKANEKSEAERKLSCPTPASASIVYLATQRLKPKSLWSSEIVIRTMK